MKNPEPGSSPLQEQEKRPEAGNPAEKEMLPSTPVDTPAHGLGFMTGQISLPDDFDRMGSKEIEEMFGGEK